MKKTVLICLLPIILFSGCMSAQLGVGGTVEYVEKQEAPKNYTLIGAVDITGFDSGSTYPDAIVRLRNKAAGMGGDFLVIDEIQYQDIDFHIYYTGYGRVYKKK